MPRNRSLNKLEADVGFEVHNYVEGKFKINEITLPISANNRNTYQTNTTFFSADRGTAKQRINLEIGGRGLDLRNASKVYIMFEFTGLDDGFVMLEPDIVDDAYGKLELILPNEVIARGTSEVLEYVYVEFNNGQKLDVGVISTRIERSFTDRGFEEAQEFYIQRIEDLIQEMARRLAESELGGITLNADWDSLIGRPTLFPPIAHRHNWSELDDVPVTFAPSPHNHPISQVDNLQVELNRIEQIASSNTGGITELPPTNWDDIQDRPTQFTPTAHRHDVSEIDGLDQGRLLPRAIHVTTINGWNPIHELDLGGGQLVSFLIYSSQDEQMPWMTVGQTGRLTGSSGRAFRTGNTGDFVHVELYPNFPEFAESEFIGMINTWNNLTNRWVNGWDLVSRTGASGNSSGGVADSVSWANITGLPSLFPPSSHTHDSRDIAITALGNISFDSITSQRGTFILTTTHEAGRPSSNTRFIVEVEIDGTTVIQRAVDLVDGAIRQRHRISNTWSSWRRIDGADASQLIGGTIPDERISDSFLREWQISSRIEDALAQVNTGSNLEGLPERVLKLEESLSEISKKILNILGGIV